MKPRFLILLSSFVILHSSLAAPRPNIVVILIDDLRADALSCTGHPFVNSLLKNPFQRRRRAMFIELVGIDGPSSVGATCARDQGCMPLLRTFVVFFTGFYRHGAPTALWLGPCGSRVFQQAVKTPSIDRIAKEGATFRHAFVTTPLCLPSRASFLTGLYPHTHGAKGNADYLALSYQLPTFPRLLQPAGYETAFIGKWHLGDDAGPRPGFDHWVSFKGQGVYMDPEINVDGKASKTSGYLTDILTGHAVEFIQRAHTKPFLLYLAHKAVHAPFIPAERHKHLFADVPIVRAASAKDPWEGKPVLRRPGVKLSPTDSDVHTSDENIRDQLRCLMAVDEGVKQIFDALELTNQLDKTLIVFTSDHGYFWGEHDLGGKHGPYEEALRIPLLMRYPKLVKSGTTFDPFALSIDLAPTLLELAGVPPPDTVQGRSLLPLLQGSASHTRSSFLAEFFLGNGTNRFPTWQAVRTERWKYIRYTDFPEMDELYDLRADSMEMKNLIHDPGAEAARGEMKAELERLLSESR